MHSILRLARERECVDRHVKALKLRNRASTAALVLVAVTDESKPGNVISGHGGHAAEQGVLKIGTARRAITRVRTGYSEGDAGGQCVSAAIERNDFDPVPAFRTIHVLYQRRGAGKIGITNTARGIDQNGRSGASLRKIDRRLTQGEQDCREAAGLQNQRDANGSAATTSSPNKGARASGTRRDEQTST